MQTYIAAENMYMVNICEYAMSKLGGPLSVANVCDECQNSVCGKHDA